MIDLNIHIKCTLNNTIINVTDLKGDSLYTISSGYLDFKKTKRTAGYSAKICLENALNKVKSFNPRYVNVYIKGLGYGRNSILKELKNTELYIILIQDITPIPFNGCRPKKQRRI